jgi:hypothetical protein
MTRIRTGTERDSVNALCERALSRHGGSPLSHWYPRPDSNRHALRRGILNPVNCPQMHLLSRGRLTETCRDRIGKCERSLPAGS